MKPESRLIKAVHDLVHPDVYREKFHNTFRGGTPDCYYLGFDDDAWIEWKWVAKLPKKIVPKLRPLQMVWLVRAWDRGAKVFVVVGSPDGCVVLTGPAEWQKGVIRDEAQVLSKYVIARWIEGLCGLDISTTPPPGQVPSTRSVSSSP
jgi:hypothetical protein